MIFLNFMSTFQALKWGFVIPKGQESAKFFFLKKGHVGY
jgi:hypothetical protein